MTWYALEDFTTGRLVSASDWNKRMGITGNLAESAVAKVTTAGQIPIASGANALTVTTLAALLNAQSNVLAADFAMTASVWNDLASLSLPAGVWLTFGVAYLDGQTSSTTANQVTLRIYDTTNSAYLADTAIGNQGSAALTNLQSYFALGKPTTLAGTATVKLQAMPNAANLRATRSFSGVGFATMLVAVKVG